jgi:hypothetical protein
VSTEARFATLDAAHAEGAKGPSLAEAIERGRSLGRQWLLWLWCESELRPEGLDVAPFGEVSLWLEHRLRLEAASELGVEVQAMVGQTPSTGPEARAAVRNGRLPTSARIALRAGEQDFSCVVDADTLGLSSVRIPTLLKGEGDDPFYERMQLLEQIESAVESLYRAFLDLRLSDDWVLVVLPAMREWAAAIEGDATHRYRAMRDRSAGAR